MAKKGIKFRQGDVYVYHRKGVAPKKGEEVKNRTVAYGEYSGHLHRIDGASVHQSDGGLFACEGDQCSVLHHTYQDSTKVAEHNPIVIPAGTATVGIQREWNAYQAVARNVMD